MDPNRLKSLRWRFTGWGALLGGGLRRHALPQLVGARPPQAPPVVAGAGAGGAAGWLRRHALRQLVGSGSPEAARVVAEAVAGCRGAALREVLLEGLRRVEDPGCRDAVCAVWAATRHADLSGLVVFWGWVAGGPP